MVIAHTLTYKSETAPLKRVGKNGDSPSNLKDNDLGTPVEEKTALPAVIAAEMNLASLPLKKKNS